MKPAYAVLLTALLLAAAAPAQERPPAEPSTFVASLQVDGRAEPIQAAQTSAGPLFLLDPIAQRLGAQIEFVPIGQSHRVRIAGVDVLLGPGTSAMTIGTDIIELRQPPVLSSSGLLVPLEALEQSFGSLLGVGLRWFRDERVLELTSRRSREVELDVQVVHIQGVTTVVLQFDHTPTYEVSTRPGAVEIALPAERLRLARDPRPPRQSLLERVETDDHHVRLFLAPGAAAAEPTCSPRAPVRQRATGCDSSSTCRAPRSRTCPATPRPRRPFSTRPTTRPACARSCSIPGTAGPSRARSGRPAPRRRSSRSSSPRRSSASSRSAWRCRSC